MEFAPHAAIRRSLEIEKEFLRLSVFDHRIDGLLARLTQAIK